MMRLDSTEKKCHLIHLYLRRRRRPLGLRSPKTVDYYQQESEAQTVDNL